MAGVLACAAVSVGKLYSNIRHMQCLSTKNFVVSACGLPFSGCCGAVPGEVSSVSRFSSVGYGVFGPGWRGGVWLTDEHGDSAWVGFFSVVCGRLAGRIASLCEGRT